MRFYTIIINGQETPAVSVDGGQTAFSLGSLGYSYEDMNQLICRTTSEELEIMKKAAAEAVPEKSIDLRETGFCAPIVRPRQDVICLGINYDEHAKEAGMYSKEAFGGERPYTIYFSKRVSRANGSGETVPSYAGLVDSLDYEAELGVVLGQDVKDISESEALSAVFGYTIVNDVSARNLQTRHKQWYKGKSLDGFTPMGPCIVTPDELETYGGPGNLRISCTVNGQIRQDSNTRYMIQTVAGAISELSQGMTLQKGTIIATGTPAGVGMGMKPPQFLQPGDEVICEIEGIGRLVSPIGE